MIRLWLVSFFIIPSHSILFSNEPRLESVDGNLLIVAARDRNITLATSGRGTVTINGQDVKEVVESAKSAARTAIARDNALNSVQQDVRKLITEQLAFTQRIFSLEAGVLDNTSIPSRSSQPYNSQSNWQNVLLRVIQLEKYLRKNECSRNPCRHGGTCLDLYMKYVCLCPDGWEGDRCHIDTNECVTLASTDLGCQNGATCVNKRGTYECICRPGFFGRHCTKRNDDCTTGSSSELCDHGTCVSLEGKSAGYKCICDQGWTKVAGQQMCSVDVDECITAPCSRVPKVNCINIPGSFRCESCPPGYTGNGHSCDDVNECAISNGGCSVAPLVACVNTIGSSRCGPCPPGYIGDGTTCNFVGRCRVDNGGCHPQAFCQEVGTNVQCTCNSGYTGSGIGLYGCNPSSAAVGTFHPCNSNPCANGRCVPTSNYNYTCDCFVGFSGARCEQSRDPCFSSPCANGGKCITRGNNFRCRCTKLYTGPLCRVERSDCGGYLGADDGTLEFPNTPALRTRYNLNCSWRIRVNDSLVINITFDNFSLGPATKGDCISEWLQIYDGKDVGNHNMIGKFCGSQLPQNGTIISSSNNLLLWFKSDRPSPDRTFKFSWNATTPVCGGYLNARVHGTFSSPGSPGRYPINRDCYWRVSTTLGQRISFTFFQLSIENHDNCQYDYIEFLDGLNPDSPVIVRHCTSGTPAPFITPGNVALIHFHSDNLSSDRGFQISYNPSPGIPGCGGIFTDRLGEIRSITLDNKYKDNLDCVWLIKAPNQQKIKLEFKEFELESSSGCIHDFLEVRLGDTSNAPLAGRFCGSDDPETITSIGNSLYIRFKTDNSVGSTGFLLIYTQLCGGTYVSSSGYFTSPMYPNHYPNLIECDYLIDLPPGKSIILRFLDFDVEKGSNRYCLLDNLQIFDGPSVMSKSFGKFCGSNRPPTIASSHNKLLLRFHSDISITNIGWAVNYSTVDTTCGGIFSNLSGVISSPVAANGYPPNIDCHWVIHVPTQYVVQINFPSFHLEEGQDTCFYDYLAIYDNSTINPFLMGKFCGKKIPNSMTSTGNIIYIKFVSDSSRTGDGFQLSYLAVPTSKVCGGNFFARSGDLKSPNYPMRYPSDKECIWIIKVPVGQKIQLKTKTFLLEPHSDCSFDYLEIRNGGTDLSPLLGKYCGSVKPPTITSFSNTLYVKFYADQLRSFKGFHLTWDSSLTGCGGTLSGVTGSIISPNYPEPYGASATCIYKIRTSMGSHIILNFIDIELESSADCFSDYLEIFDGRDENAKSFGKRCISSRDIESIESTANILFIKFVSDISVAGKGFFVKYRTQCSTTVGGERGIIESPNYPDSIEGGVSCQWVINVELGNKINLTFSDYSLDDMNCNQSYIQIGEGPKGEPTTNQLVKICSKPSPNVFISSFQQSVTITLKTTESVTGFFRIEWISVGCGGTLTKPTGALSSPNYPDFYPHSTHCLWKIIVDPDKSIKFTVHKISIEQNRNCQADALEIYGGRDLTSPLLTKLCYLDDNAFSVYSSGNYLTALFRTDETSTGHGFMASYSTVALKCGGEFSTLMGSIHSRNYPLNYDPKDDCIWTLGVTPNHRINFTFIEFDLPDDPGCNNTYVQVFDGNIEGKSLFKGCGNRALTQRTIISTSNKLTIRMKSGLEVSSKGFLANFTMTCGAVIVANEPGVIWLDDPFVTTLQKLHCDWTIISPEPDGHITADITEMSIGEYNDYNSCFFESLKVYDGENSNATLLGKLCGGFKPLPFVSNGNSLYISFEVAYSTSYGNALSITYSSTTSSCGGEYYAISGRIASPNYPGTYRPNIECIWTLKAAPSNTIQLNWQKFSIADNTFCNNEYVEIRERDNGGKLLGTFCGSNVPNNLTSINGFWIKFASGNGPPFPDSGFLLEFNLEYLNEVSGTSGVIANPLFPKRSKTALSWRVTVKSKKIIQFTVDNLFLDSECFSHVMLYDGYDNSAKGDTICGIKVPQTFTSSSNVVFIEAFSTYSSGMRYKITWKEIGNPSTIIPRNSSSCGGELGLNQSFQSITITSPNYPKEYTSGATCVWTVRAPPGYHIGYSIPKISLNPSMGCILENVATYDGDSAVPKGVYCLRNDTQDLQNAIEVGQVLKVKFQSSFLYAKAGFEMIVDLDQGGIIEASSGVIDFNWNASIWRPWIQRKTYHEWFIRVNRGRKIKVTFESFEIASSIDGSCKEKYVMLRNGHHADSPLLGAGKFCGKTPTIPMTSAENLYVKVNTPWRTSSFRLKFEEVGFKCGGRLLLSNDIKIITFATPNYPNSPNPKIECIWIIQGDFDKNIQIDFIDRFDLKASDADCTSEYVEIKDGASQLAPSLGRYCSEAPSSIISSENWLYVKYFTNVTDPNNGFRAKVSIDQCGGRIRGSQGQIQSPKYPHLGQNIDCIWTIQTSTYQNLLINFLDVDLPNVTTRYRPNFLRDRDDYGHLFFMYANTGCSFQSVLIVTEPLPPTVPSNNGTTSPPLNLLDSLRRVVKWPSDALVLSYYCQRSVPPPLRVSGNSVSLRLRASNFEGEYRGFKLNFTSEDSECGGIFVTPHGTITSPRYPVEIPRPYYCKWNIRVALGRRITIKFLDFDLAGNHMEQRLYMYEDVARAEVAILHKLKPPENEYKTSSNSLKLSFHTVAFSGTAHRGFLLKYSSDEAAICGGYLNNTEGVIESPKNQTVYSCEWFLRPQLPANSSLILIIEDAVMSDARKEWCTPRQGVGLFISSRVPNAEDFSVEICKNSTYRVIASPIGNINIKAGQNRKYYTPVSFRIRYSVSPCGGVITSAMMPYYITSPGYPNAYPLNVKCGWRFDINPMQNIKLTLENLNLDEKCLDQLIFYNGGGPDSPLISVQCGKIIGIPSIVSQLQSFYIAFNANGGSRGVGFKVKAEINYLACGGVIFDEGIEMRSPNYPSKYPANTECEWEIRAAAGMHIGIEFTDRFHLELSANCTNDFILVTELINDSWTYVTRLCGRKLPSVVHSITNTVRVLFRSNDQIEGDGFKAKWLAKCGGTLTGAFGTITSPGFPQPYLPNKFCQYKIDSKGQLITLNFTFFELEGSLYNVDDCDYDYVEIIDNSLNGKSIGRFCGQTAPQPITSSHALIIRFNSDNFSNFKGFVMEYKMEQCGGFINESKMISYSLPSGIVQSKDCIWEITAPPNMIIILKIINMSLPSNVNCSFTYISLSEPVPGLGNSTLLARICGSPKIVLPFTSSANRMSMSLHKRTHSYYSYYFKAYISFQYGPASGCGGNMLLSTDSGIKTLMSPEFSKGGPYKEFLDCQWLIAAPEGQHIVGTFTTFDVDSCNRTDCSCDLLEVRDGVGPYSDLISKNCGSVLPEKIVSSFNKLWIRFSTDGSYNGRGFSINFVSKLSPCGETILKATKEVQRLTSPGFPNNYPDGLRCSWTITGGFSAKPINWYNQIHIHLVSWDLQNSDDCVNDHISLEDYGNREFKSSSVKDRDVGTPAVIYHGRLYDRAFSYIARRTVGKSLFCGNGSSIDYYAVSGQAVVGFKSDAEIEGRGFELEYSLSPCSRNYTGNQGRIRNAHLVMNDPCNIRIQAPSINHTIALYFFSFIMPSDCSKSYLQVHDGSNNAAPILIKTCGYANLSPIYSSGQYLYLTLYTSVAGYDDIDLTYTTTDQGQGCGGEIFNYAGTFTSPQYPQHVRTNQECRWDLSVPEGLDIILKFIEFDLGTSNTCGSDYVEVFDKDPKTGTLVKRSRFCGGDDPAMMVGNSGLIAVKYTRSVHNSGTGWKASFIGVQPGVKINDF